MSYSTMIMMMMMMMNAINNNNNNNNNRNRNVLSVIISTANHKLFMIKQLMPKYIKTNYES